jgi:hypothetical protein
MNFKMMHCPICREPLTLFDRLIFGGHFREKHSEYLHTFKKWRFAGILSWTSFGVFSTIGWLLAYPVKSFAYGLVLISAVLNLFISLKLLDINGKYRKLGHK